MFNGIRRTGIPRKEAEHAVDYGDFRLAASLGASRAPAARELLRQQHSAFAMHECVQAGSNGAVRLAGGGVQAVFRPMYLRGGLRLTQASTAADALLAEERLGHAADRRGMGRSDPLLLEPRTSARTRGVHDHGERQRQSRRSALGTEVRRDMVPDHAGVLRQNLRRADTNVHGRVECLARIHRGGDHRNVHDGRLASGRQVRAGSHLHAGRQFPTAVLVSVSILRNGAADTTVIPSRESYQWLPFFYEH